MRCHRELWLWLGGLFLTVYTFLTAVAIAYFVKEPRYSLFGNVWMPVACASFLVAFISFFAAARSWPFPPWAHAGFPNITVEIHGTSSTDTEREASTGLDVPAHLRSYHARFTSRETERNASLTLLLYVKLIAGSWGRAGEAVCPPPSWTLPPSLGVSPIVMPIALPPGSEVSGQVVFEIPRYYLGKIANPLDGRLEIVDHISGTRVSIPAELGTHNRRTMTPVSGGAEILAQHDEEREDAQRDGEQADAQRDAPLAQS